MRRGIHLLVTPRHKWSVIRFKLRAAGSMCTIPPIKSRTARRTLASALVFQVRWIRPTTVRRRELRKSTSWAKVTPPSSLKSDGTGLAASGSNLYFYQNGTETPITIPGIIPSSGNLAFGMYVDDRNDIIERLPGSNAGSVIYSGASQGYGGGTTTTLLGPSGQPFEVFRG